MPKELEMQTEMQKFYNHKTVFLTGGTGFVGKAFIEKILRVTDVERIYMLTRCKRGKRINERIEHTFKDALFEGLSKLESQPLRRVVPVQGDCTLPQLGLSSEDQLRLINEVDIVVHSAATVRFSEPLSVAVPINLCATLDIIELAKKMTRLKAFLHVSSAFSNCTQPHIAEQYYVQNLGITATEMRRMFEELSAEELDSKWETLRGEFPNTYCFTKALAEEAILTQGSELPTCIFRPGIIVSSNSEPIPGWLDNVYGPISIIYGTAVGVLRVMYIRMEANAAMVPVDFCVNTMLACAYNTAKSVKQSSSHPPIYNFVPDERNKLKWLDYKALILTYGYKMPLTRMLWFPFITDTHFLFFYKFLCLFYHTIPGYLFDLLLLLKGRKTRMVKTYRKIHQQFDLMNYFMVNEWSFDTDNTRQLWESLSEQDQRIFPFNMVSLNWPEFIHNSLWGMRRFIAKEEPSTVPKGLQIQSRLFILHRTTQIFVYGGGLILLLCILTRIFRFIFV